MRPEKVSAILLAGGFSSRMGADKASLQLGGRTLLEHQAEKLRSLGIREILISGCETCPPGTVYVPDVYPHRGPLSGIHAGLAAIHNGCALVLPVDMPLIPAETLLQLMDAHGEKSITALTLAERPEPLAAVYDAALAPLAEKILRGERHSPRRLFDLCGWQSVPFTGDPVLLTNCNTPEEFAALQKYF